MSFKWVGISEDTAETLLALLKKAKKHNPELTETAFIEHIICDWLEPYRQGKENIKLIKGKVIVRNNLKQALKQSGKKQVDVAEQVGISRPYFGQLMAGKYEPSLAVAYLIVNALGYPPEKITDIFYLEPTEE